MSKFVDNELGKRLRFLRGEQTQQEFAARLGTDKNTIGRYERGERLPDSAFLCRLHRLSGVSLDWLLTGYGSRPCGLFDGTEDFPSLDEDLAAATASGIVAVYRRHGRIPADEDLGRTLARILNRLMETYADPEERRIGLKLALTQVEREIFPPREG
jgi:transcriptional regulator with XRE-family HTH domain